MADDDEEEFSSADDNEFGQGRQPAGRADDDFDQDFDDSASMPQGAGQTDTFRASAVTNQPYDEAVELSDDEGEQPSPAVPGRAEPEEGEIMAVTNKPFDEAVELSSEDSVDDDGERGPPIARPAGSAGSSDEAGGRSPAPAASTETRRPQGGPQIKLTAMAPGGGLRQDNAGEENADGDQMGSSKGMGMMAASQMGRGGMGGHFGGLSPQGAPDSEGRGYGSGGGDDDDDEEEGEGGDQMGESGPIGEGMYNPAEYAGLEVSSEIKELFQYITRYKPHNIELETKMRPFIPDYIPAVGDIDPFVKVPRPDGKADNLGLDNLDEPAAVQSDPNVLQLQLRAVSKSSAAQVMAVASVDAAEKDPKAISRWISSINDLHRHKPPPSVHYSKPMPDIEALMQIWPAQFEELLETAKLPGADLQAELPELVRIVCALLDIPVYSSLTESLHVLFSLYSDFKANVHFQQQIGEEGGMSGMDGMGGSDGMGMLNDAMGHSDQLIMPS